jgi:phosphotransferase system HPr (HPr) family protein
VVQALLESAVQTQQITVNHTAKGEAMHKPQELILTIDHPEGLHLRPAALFVRTAARFQSRITITNLSRPDTPNADAKSMFGVMLMAVSQGHQVRLEAEGDDAEAAIAALRQIVERRFAEDD